MISHKTIEIPTNGQGFYLITDQITKTFSDLPNSGLINLFITHTSAGLTINENCDPSVRQDLKHFLNYLVPEEWPNYTHTLEGADDMPAHIKASLFGYHLSIPIINKKLQLGRWQGIYLSEFRTSSQVRKIIGSLYQ